MVSMTQNTILCNEYLNFKTAYTATGQAIQVVKDTGTILFSDPEFAQAYPNSVAAFQAYLIALNNCINTFLQSLPVEPIIDG